MMALLKVSQIYMHVYRYIYMSKVVLLLWELSAIIFPLRAALQLAIPVSSWDDAM